MSITWCAAGLRALRTPTIDVSLVDLFCITEKDVTAEAVNKKLTEASKGALKGYLAVSDEELVSVDYIGNSYSSIVDLKSTKVIEKNMLEVLSWYDNEWGYSERVIDLLKYIDSK